MGKTLFRYLLANALAEGLGFIATGKLTISTHADTLLVLKLSSPFVIRALVVAEYQIPETLFFCLRVCQEPILKLAGHAFAIMQVPPKGLFITPGLNLLGLLRDSGAGSHRRR